MGPTRLLLQIVLLCSVASLFGTGCVQDATSPPTVTLAEGRATNPTTAIDGTASTVYIAWVTPGEGGTDVYLSRWEADEEPEAAVRVNDVPGDAHAHAQAPAQVAVGADGVVYVAWVASRNVEGRRFPATDLRFARSTDGGRTFAPALTINDDAGGLPAGHSFHDLAVGPDGAIYVAWLDSREQARAEVQDDGAEGPGTELRVARSADGGRSFTPGIVVAQGTCECCRASVEVDDDGTLFVAWRHLFGPDVRDIAVARSTDGGRTFTAPARVHRDGWHIAGCPHSGPSVRVDDAGRTHVAWYTGAEGRIGLHYAVSTDTARSFRAPTRLVGDVPVSQVRVATSGAAAWLAYEDARADRVVLAQSGQDGEVQEIMRFEGALPALTATRTHAVLVWKGPDGVQAYRRSVE